MGGLWDEPGGPRTHGAIAQNVYLFAASNGLAAVVRAWIDRTAIADVLGLMHDQQVLLSQTVGYPKVRYLNGWSEVHRALLIHIKTEKAIIRYK